MNCEPGRQLGTQRDAVKAVLADCDEVILQTMEKAEQGSPDSMLLGPNLPGNAEKLLSHG